MTEPVLRRPWWKRKRTWAAAVLWLAIAYPLSIWPVCYLIGAGYLTGNTEAAVMAVYEPLRPIMTDGDEIRFGFVWFNAVGYYFYKLGQQHTPSD